MFNYFNYSDHLLIDNYLIFFPVKYVNCLLTINTNKMALYGKINVTNK